MKSTVARLLIAIPTLTFLWSCASTDDAPKVAWERFDAFGQQLDSRGLDTEFAPFFTRWAYQDILQAETDDKEYVKLTLAYPLYFDKIVSHRERQLATGACLVVNGETPHGDNASLSIELLQEDGQLKFNDANLLFVDSPEDYLPTAACPAETRAL